MKRTLERRANPRKIRKARAASFTALIGARPPSRTAAAKQLHELGFRHPDRARSCIGRLHTDDWQRRSLRKIFNPLLRACAQSADPDRALVSFERLVQALPNANMFYHYLAAAPDRLRWLVTVFAHSQALADTLTRDATYFHFLIAQETLAAPREKPWLDAELRRLLLPVRSADERYDVVRTFRRRETLRIGSRDLLGRATVEQTTLELSNLADVCLQAVYEIAWAKVAEQLKAEPGQPVSRLPIDSAQGLRETAPTRREAQRMASRSSALQGERPPGLASRSSALQGAAKGLAVIGMGKLGGQELNYSSDVDVIFVYGEDGPLTVRLSYREFYTKLAEEIIRAVGGASKVGSIFRIDLRLRPEGGSGPLVQSLEGCENYYAGWGETWERMALVKARVVAGDQGVGEEFVKMVQPFIYRRHTGENIIQQMARIKQRIEQEIVREHRLTRHVKLGIGGIREIEFIVQSFQVLRGAWVPALRERMTLRALPQLVQAKLLPAADAERLGAAYRFLRNVEHRLQMELDLQTHTIPDEAHALYRLARSLGFADVASFEAAQQQHTGAVRQIYEQVLAEATTGEAERLAPEQLAKHLAPVGFRDLPAARRTVEQLWAGPGFVHVSQRTRDLFAQLLPALLARLRSVAEPDAALARFDQFIAAYGSRGLLYELFGRNPRLLEMLVRVGDASRYLTEIMIQQPELFDEVCQGVTLSEPKNAARMQADLAATVAAGEAWDLARRWKRAEFLRIGIEDVMGLIDLEPLHQEISQLAGVCLTFVLDQAQRDQGGARVPFAVIGLGKFGGQELGYGADLDVLFVTADEADQTQAIRLASLVMNQMKTRTAAGRFFEVDPRLRPDGEKGPLASSLEAHRRYYAKRGQLWERQALTKARWVAGDESVGRSFLTMIQGIVYREALPDQDLAAIRRMRQRIETERGDRAHPEREFKTGPGGLIDVEFAVQALQLRHGAAHPALRTAHTLAALNRLTALGVVDDEQSYHLRRHYLFVRRMESVLRRMENVSVSRLPAEPLAQDQLAKRLGIASGVELVRQYQSEARKVREIYSALMR